MRQPELLRGPRTSRSPAGPARPGSTGLCVPHLVYNAVATGVSLLAWLVLLPIGVCLDALYPVWMVLVAINRGWPAAMARTLASIEQWVVEVILYATMASDRPPHFGLSLEPEATAT